LELSLLGKSYFGEPIAKRLSRLELNEFGKVCTSADLAARIDTLEANATSNAEKTKVNELVSYQSPKSIVHDYRNYVHGLFQNDINAPQKEQINTVVDQIEYLESTAFGKIHHNKPLQKRVGALEERYYGAPNDDDSSLTHRVAKLLSLVNSGSTKSGIAHG
jgi:DNA-binding NarL/FixJ family response regulator